MEVSRSCSNGRWLGENSHGNSIQGDGYANYAEVRQGEFDEAKTACVNMMDLRYNSDFHNGEAYSWFNEAFQLVKQFCTEGSYRLFPDRISLPTTISNGKQIEIAHRWNNLVGDIVRQIFPSGRINIK